MATKSVGCCLAHLQSGWDEQVAIFRSRTQLELRLAVVSPSAAISHRDTVILSWTICGSSIWSPDHTHLQTCMLCLTVLWIKRNKLSQTQTRHFFTKIFIYMVLRIFANQKVRRLLQVFCSEHHQTSLTCLSTVHLLNIINSTLHAGNTRQLPILSASIQLGKTFKVGWSIIFVLILHENLRYCHSISLKF